MLPMRDRRQILADWVRKERAKRGWSQSELADRMEKVRGVVNKLERANNDPTLETLAVLAKAFGYPLSIVLDVLGYDVKLADDDPWVEAMNYKTSLLPESQRSMVDVLIDSILEVEQRERKTKTKPKAKPAV